MYRFSRAIYRELAPLISERRPVGEASSHEQLLRACETAVERLLTDRYYFARPARTLFLDIRTLFPLRAQQRVYCVVCKYLDLAQQLIAEHPEVIRLATDGRPPECRATTRRGATCQRTPLPHNGYCPSHQHLADNEDEQRLLAA
jgi:hypothetical protein